MMMSAAFAAERKPSAPTTPNFCSRITEMSGKIDQQVTDRESKLTSARTDRDTRLKDREDSQAKKLIDLRTAEDQRKAERFAQLEAKATTDVQKQAVAAFEKAVSAAITERRTAVDAAQQAFWNGLHEAINARKTTMDATIKTLSDSIKAVVAKAKSDCTSGVAPATARATFVASLKTAREKFQADRKSKDKLSDTVHTLVDARKTATEKALADFKATMEKARAALKAAFPENTPPETNKEMNHEKETNE
jgi:hypothetical protein